jgi:hypothetical protein
VQQSKGSPAMLTLELLLRILKSRAIPTSEVPPAKVIDIGSIGPYSNRVYGRPPVKRVPRFGW